jgi:coenzyme PQQ biosynthesis protein B
MRQQAMPLVVYATDKTRAALDWIDILLKPFCRIEWRTTAGDFQSLGNGIGCRAIELGESIAFQLRDEVSRATALVAPAVGKITNELRDAVHRSDLVLFDGTFWSDDELRAVRPGARSGREMNHVPISDGSLDLLRHSPARRKIYTHINNTNPILMPGSSERIQVEHAGVEIACDGLEIVS